MSMYFVLGLLLLWSGLISAFLSSEDLSSEEWEDSCTEETGVSKDALNCLPFGPCPDDPKLKCYVKCALTEMSLPVNEDGVVDPDRMIEVLDDDEKEAYEASIRLCAKVRGSDACDTAYLQVECWAAEGLYDESSEEENSEETSSEEESRKEKQFREWSDGCIAETGVDEDIIPCLSTGVCPEDQKLKCFVKCLVTTASVPMTDDGSIDVETLIAEGQLDEKRSSTMRECATIKGADACDTAYLTVSCWILKRLIGDGSTQTYQELLDRR